MPLFQALENVLGLKALAWDYNSKAFVSPARPEFVWNRSGLHAAECPVHAEHKPPVYTCTCGIYAAYQLSVAYEYTHTSTLSPIFLVEASGMIVHHQMGFRSNELTMRMVAVPQQAGKADRILNMAAHQAADYFDIPKVEEATLVMMMDLWNIHYRLRECTINPELEGKRMPWYQIQSRELRGIPIEQLETMAQEVLG